SISGAAGSVCPNSSNSYCAPSNAVSSNWSISGNGSISGSGNCIQVIAGSGCGQSYTLSLEYTNDQGCTSSCEVTVMVEDTTAPSISASGSVDNGADLGANPSAAEIAAALGSATATDNCGGNPAVIFVDGSVTEEGCYRSQTRTFTATDACGNSSTDSRTIAWLVDVEAPVITYSCENSSTVNTDLGCNPTDTQIEEALCTITVTDN
ncbi:MAG: hypothetical protein ACKO7B_20820, partial [Flavobacteriales bacterium]